MLNPIKFKVIVYWYLDVIFDAEIKPQPLKPMF